MEYPIPPIEFGQSGFIGLSALSGGSSAVVPGLVLSTCERSKKERMVRLDAYTLTITFRLPESPDGELFCYAYTAAVDRALGEDPALGGVAGRAVLMGKKYVPPGGIREPGIR
jgi:hypothetical protein